MTLRRTRKLQTWCCYVSCASFFLHSLLLAIGNQTLGMLKDTSLVSVLAISDILRVGNEYATKHFNFFETYTYIALTYLLLTLLLSQMVHKLEFSYRI